MKIMVLADEPAPILWEYLDRRKLEGVELILSCGDLPASYLSFLTCFTHAPILYIHGNHDDSYSRGKDTSLETLLTDNGIHILSDSARLIDNRFYVIGRRDRSQKGRRELKELISGLDTSKYMIVLDHQPADYDAEAATAADLVLSGHTHGGQLIPATFVGEWLGMNDNTYGYERRSDTDFIVTSGIADWEIKFKTGTKSEYVIIEIGNAVAK